MTKNIKKYRVAHLGLGSRGHRHINGFLDNPEKFEVVALCDLNEERLKEAGQRYNIESMYTDVRQMLTDTKPDVFCFVTGLSVRLEMVELAAEFGIKAVAFEKPIAVTIDEAYKMKCIFEKNDIKAVVCHQLKYQTSLRKLKEVITSGLLGEITHAHATTVPWFMQLGTHFTDYLLWANGGYKAKWAVGHIHGKYHLQDDNGHPGADYMLGEFFLDNGVRAIIQCGYLSPSYLPQEKYWFDDRLTFYGTKGYAWADNNGNWYVVSADLSGGIESGSNNEPRGQQEEEMMAEYMQDFADWLDDNRAMHPCSYNIAYHGFEILQAIQKSAMEHRRVDLPLNPEEFYDMNERVLKELPEVEPNEEWTSHGIPPKRQQLK